LRITAASPSVRPSTSTGSTRGCNEDVDHRLRRLRALLLPGMDGTGRLFTACCRALPPSVQPIIATYGPLASPCPRRPTRSWPSRSRAPWRSGSPSGHPLHRKRSCWSPRSFAPRARLRAGSGLCSCRLCSPSRHRRASSADGCSARTPTTRR
jgi:hypothetical protein